MGESIFSFGDNSVAKGYDSVLVPVLFEPWARGLISTHGPWEGCHVLDLATGTGIVAALLSEQVGANGRVTGSDLNPQMLSVAAERCASRANVSLVEGTADAIDLPDASVDVVTCQQGFQFFPDRDAAAREIRRVLKPGGRAIVTTWRCVDECEFFGVMCAVIDSLGHAELGAAMRMPFDNMPDDELAGPFEAAGFTSVRRTREEKDFTIPGGIDAAVEGTFATPIGPKLRELPDSEQDAFRAAFRARLLERFGEGSTSMGRMATNVLTATNPA